MTPRTLRLALVGVLLATGAAAAVYALQQVTHIRVADAQHDDTITRLDRLGSLLRGVADEELRSVALGVPARAAVTIPDVISQVESEAGAIGQRMHAEGATARLTTLVETARLLTDVHRRARENVRARRTLMATDIILTEGRKAAAESERILSALRSAEIHTVAAARAAGYDRVWRALGASALVWMAGLLWLGIRADTASRPVAAAAEPPRLAAGANAGAPAAEGGALSPQPSGTAVAPVAPVPTLAEVAAACGALARASTTMTFTEALESAARAVAVEGLIVWKGSGDELFAAAGVGYDARTMARIGTVSRHADHATAASWRTAAVEIVEATALTPGAIVTPICGPDGCLGVLAAEVAGGREHDANTRAALACVSAQLSTVMAAWPASGAGAAAEDAGASAPNRRHA